MNNEFLNNQLLNFEHSTIEKNDIPDCFDKSLLLDSVEKFKKTYSDFNVELFFKNNKLYKKIIRNIDDDIFTRDFDFIDIEYRANKLYSFDVNYGTYHFKSVYSYEAFSQKRIMSRNVHHFQPDIFNQEIWDGLQLIGQYDILKIQKHKEWLTKFNDFLLLFERRDKRTDLVNFIENTKPDFLNPNNEIFDLIDFNFSSK